MEPYVSLAVLLIHGNCDHGIPKTEVCGFKEGGELVALAFVTEFSLTTGHDEESDDG